MDKTNPMLVDRSGACPAGVRRAEPAVPRTPTLTTKAGLRSTCSEVVAEYLAGRWPELDGKSWPELCAFLLEELLARCPGLSTREYRVALKTRLSMRGLAPKPRSGAPLRASTRAPQPAES